MFSIAPTDNGWFEFLKGVELNSFVNFWTPTPWNVKGLKSGEKWYFLLKSPVREIAGFGEFVEYKNLTADKAWEEFGQRNGCLAREIFVKKIKQYIDKNSRQLRGNAINIEQYEIGCIVLKNCEFWDEENYRKPKDYYISFPNQIVKFKYFDLEDPFLHEIESKETNFIRVTEHRDDTKREVNQRKGQGVFKGRILKAYENKCCISGETCPELLEAAHIQPYVNEKSHHVQNGILLRVDLHRLFDSGLLGVDENYEVQISSRLPSLTYEVYSKSKISLPKKASEHPSKAALQERHHNFRE